MPTVGPIHAINVDLRRHRSRFSKCLNLADGITFNLYRDSDYIRILIQGSVTHCFVEDICDASEFLPIGRIDGFQRIRVCTPRIPTIWVTLDWLLSIPSTCALININKAEFLNSLGFKDCTHAQFNEVVEAMLYPILFGAA